VFISGLECLPFSRLSRTEGPPKNALEKSQDLRSFAEPNPCAPSNYFPDKLDVLQKSVDD
jgi:hypothetical protein